MSHPYHACSCCIVAEKGKPKRWFLLNCLPGWSGYDTSNNIYVLPSWNKTRTYLLYLPTYYIYYYIYIICWYTYIPTVDMWILTQRDHLPTYLTYSIVHVAKMRPMRLTCLSVCLYVCLSVCLSVCLFVCLYVCRWEGWSDIRHDI